MISNITVYGKNISKALDLLIKNEMIFQCFNYGVENYKGKNYKYVHISVVSNPKEEYEKFMIAQNELMGLSGLR